MANTERELDAVLSPDLVAEITDLVAEAGRLALSWFRPGIGGAISDAVEVENKRQEGDGFDPVTVADRTVEQMMRDRLLTLFPGHAITGEEFGSSGDSRFEWIIDPIDGTRAFVCGQPMWGTLLGLTIDGTPAAGWMAIPVLDEIYVGTGTDSRLITGRGLDRQPVALQTSNTEALADAVMLCTHPSMFAPGPQWERFAELADAVKMVRYGGDCMNYGLLATGEADLVVENQLAPYDIVPLVPLITGANGQISNLDGKPPVDGGYVVAAANQALHAATLAVLAS